ncbi:MAG: hypothetical protein HGA67_03155 [Candidatus Yonathbacteria bacterium]|nr:hypothetical protein [Candidatus Yonathbacteria bacterium]
MDEGFYTYFAGPNPRMLVDMIALMYSSLSASKKKLIDLLLSPLTGERNN